MFYDAHTLAPIKINSETLYMILTLSKGSRVSSVNIAIYILKIYWMGN